MLRVVEGRFHEAPKRHRPVRPDFLREKLREPRSQPVFRILGTAGEDLNHVAVEVNQSSVGIDRHSSGQPSFD